MSTSHLRNNGGWSNKRINRYRTMGLSRQRFRARARIGRLGAGRALGRVFARTRQRARFVPPLTTVVGTARFRQLNIVECGRFLHRGSVGVLRLLLGSVGFGLGVRLRSWGCWDGLRVSLGGRGRSRRGFGGAVIRDALNTVFLFFGHYYL